MSVNATEGAVAVGRDEGKVIPRPQTGGAVTIKVSSELSGGSMTAYESTRPPGDKRGPGMHAHPRFDELFYVVEGQYEFIIGNRSLRAGEGTSIFIPRGTFHDFRSIGEVAGRLLTCCTPGGIEHFFEDLAVEPQAGAEEMQAIQRKHGPDLPATRVRPECRPHARRRGSTGDATDRQTAISSSGYVARIANEPFRSVVASQSAIPRG